MDVQISTLKPSAFYLGFECLDDGGELWCGDVIRFIKSHWVLWTLIVTKGLLPVQFTLIWAAVSLLAYFFLCFVHLYCL